MAQPSRELQQIQKRPQPESSRQSERPSRKISFLPVPRDAGHSDFPGVDCFKYSGADDAKATQIRLQIHGEIALPTHGQRKIGTHNNDMKIHSIRRSGLLRIFAVIGLLGFNMFPSTASGGEHLLIVVSDFDGGSAQVESIDQETRLIRLKTCAL